MSSESMNYHIQTFSTLSCNNFTHYLPMLTRAPLALQSLHHLLAGGGSTPPSVSAPIGRREKRKKRSKARQKLLRNYFSKFFAKVKIVAPRAQKWPNFRVVRDCQTSFQKTSIMAGTIIARANPKTAFERYLIKFPHH